jgi:hypothetical protein
MTFKDKIITLVYVAAWTVIVFGAAFPSVFLKGDFTFLRESNDYIKIVHSLGIVIMLYFFEMAYCFYIQDLDKELLRKFSIVNCLLVSLAVFSLVSTVAVENITTRIVFFIVCWILMLIMKYESTKILTETLIKKRVIQLEITK